MSEPQAGNRCVDRQTLYDELWQVPGTQLARKYGVSDVARSASMPTARHPPPSARVLDDAQAWV